MRVRSGRFVHGWGMNEWVNGFSHSEAPEAGVCPSPVSEIDFPFLLDPIYDLKLSTPSPPHLVAAAVFLLLFSSSASAEWGRERLCWMYTRRVRFQADCGKDLISSNMCTPIATAKDSQGSHTWYACFLVYQLFRIYILPPSISGYVLIFQSKDAFHSSIFPVHANKLCGEKRKYLFNNFSLPT